MSVESPGTTIPVIEARRGRKRKVAGRGAKDCNILQHAAIVYRFKSMKLFSGYLQVSSTSTQAKSNKC